ncbi:MAG TPA: nuclear transport factor 2 family protein [Bryobacteraceae bacterium]|nr:nuclear transport factor 2 family protein [Bryobacteraceae bacterium]
MFLLRLVVLCAAVCAAQETKDTFLALDKQWSDAIVKGDTATLDKLLAPDLVYAHATGVVDTKASYIAKIKERRQVYKSFEQRNPRVNVYKDSAVTFSWVRVTGTNQAGPFDDKIMLIHFWVKQNNAWRLAAHQTTKIDKLP